LTITGHGFHSDGEKISIDVGGLDCKVLTSTIYEVTCEVAAGSTPSYDDDSTFISGSGLTFNRFDWPGSMTTFRTKFGTEGGWEDELTE